MQYPLFCLCSFLFFFFSLDSFGQRADRSAQANTHVGIEFGGIFQSDLLLTLDQQRPDTNNIYMFDISPVNSFRFGGYFRVDLFGRHSFETGLYQTQRRYRGSVTHIESDENLAAEVIRSISYEIPLLWSVSVRLGDNTRLANALGLSADFFPTDFGRYRPSLYQDVMRRYWVLPAMKATVGFEHQFPTAGALYLGASFHHIFTSIGFMQLQYRENNQVLGYTFLELNGTYFSIITRYIFPPRMKQ
jgi:hypothetical protein